MVGAEAEIKDKDERKPQIPKAWLHSAACWNLSSGKNFFIWGFVLIRLVWEGETADLSTLHSQTWGLLLLLSPVPQAQLVLMIPPPSLGQTGQGRAGQGSRAAPLPCPPGPDILHLFCPSPAAAPSSNSPQRAAKPGCKPQTHQALNQTILELVGRGQAHAGGPWGSVRAGLSAQVCLGALGSPAQSPPGSAQLSPWQNPLSILTEPTWQSLP